jgi:hypothetical protein
MAEKQRMEIDAGLLEELRARARERSRTEGELLEENVRTTSSWRQGDRTAWAISSKVSSVVVGREASSPSPRKRQ